MGVVHQDMRRALVDAIPGLVAVAVLVWWSTDQGGYFQRTWYPGTLLLLGVLVATAIGAPGELSRAAQGGARRPRRAGGLHRVELLQHLVGGRARAGMGRRQPRAAVPDPVRAVQPRRGRAGSRAG